MDQNLSNFVEFHIRIFIGCEMDLNMDSIFFMNRNTCMVFISELDADT
jgi:hypothetical protein